MRAAVVNAALFVVAVALAVLVIAALALFSAVIAHVIVNVETWIGAA